MSIKQDGTHDPAVEEARDTIADDIADSRTDMDADDGAPVEDAGGMDDNGEADADGDVSEVTADLEDDGPPPCTTDCVPVVWVPAGTFLMGAVNIPGESRPQHEVMLTRGFWMDKYEVRAGPLGRSMKFSEAAANAAHVIVDRNHIALGAVAVRVVVRVSVLGVASLRARAVNVHQLVVAGVRGRLHPALALPERNVDSVIARRSLDMGACSNSPCP